MWPVAAVWLLLSGVASAAGEGAVPLPQGETPLGEIGCYGVAYQRDGQAAVAMPDGWFGVGPYDITCQPGLRALGKSVLLLRPPRTAPGILQIDYPLSLPAVFPIELRFFLALAMDAALPGRSDGVTVRCLLRSAAGKSALLLDHQHDSTRWADFRFDLSAHAGSTVTIRFIVDPGPRRHAEWDRLYLGDATIRCGTDGPSRREQIERLTSTRAYQAATSLSLQPLANRSDVGILPSALVQGSNDLTLSGGRYRLAYHGPDIDLVYLYESRTGTLDDWSVSVDGGESFAIAQGGGLTAAVRTTRGLENRTAQGGVPLYHVITGRSSLQTCWMYPIEDGPLLVVWNFRLTGKILSITCDEPQGRIAEFSLGQVAPHPYRRLVRVPYLKDPVLYLPGRNTFLSRNLDWTTSGASWTEPSISRYNPRTDGIRNPCHEQAFLALSPHLVEVLPNIPHAPSPYLSSLASEILWDRWGHQGLDFLGTADLLRRFRDHGITRLAALVHVWQRFGYDVKLPDHLPANPDLGGDAALAEIGRAARESGYRFALHENYLDLYPDAPSYDPSALVRLPNGNPWPSWKNPFTGIQSFGIKPDYALRYATAQAPEVHRRYGTTAGFVDELTCIMPGAQVDHEAGQPLAGMLRSRVQGTDAMGRWMREAHQGPVFGEGGDHMYWAGWFDAVEGKLWGYEGGENAELLPDFDLLKIHPQMVQHGMGRAHTWSEGGATWRRQWDVNLGSTLQADQYRMYEAAYGHGGYILSGKTGNTPWIAREHHLLYPVQTLSIPAKITEIAYEMEGLFVSSTVAAALGDAMRLRVRYDNGLTVWANRGAVPWVVEGRTLPQWGFLALGPGVESGTTLRAGRFADYARCRDYLYADARTSTAASLPRKEKAVEPRLRELTHVGGNRIRIAYDWQVGEGLPQDYRCFVHFLENTGTPEERISFQQDHDPVRRTSTWRPGETIVDGPYELTIPPGTASTFVIATGLYRPRERFVPLQGPLLPNDRVLLAEIREERRDGVVISVTLLDTARAVERYTLTRADFMAHTNPLGTWVNFGTVATNGAVKIELRPTTLTVFPYPRDEAFGLSLDVVTLLPGLDPTILEVRALEAGTGRDLGRQELTFVKGRLSFALGRAGAGRYVIRRRVALE